MAAALTLITSFSMLSILSMAACSSYSVSYDDDFPTNDYMDLEADEDPEEFETLEVSHSNDCTVEVTMTVLEGAGASGIISF